MAQAQIEQIPIETPLELVEKFLDDTYAIFFRGFLFQLSCFLLIGTKGIKLFLYIFLFLSLYKFFRHIYTINEEPRASPGSNDFF